MDRFNLSSFTFFGDCKWNKVSLQHIKAVVDSLNKIISNKPSGSKFSGEMCAFLVTKA